MGLIRVNVECYAGRKADERPIRFLLDGRPFQVEAVLDQWYDPESIFYKSPGVAQLRKLIWTSVLSFITSRMSWVAWERRY